MTPGKELATQNLFFFHKFTAAPRKKKEAKKKEATAVLFIKH
jgi:hypothetical protein